MNENKIYLVKFSLLLLMIEVALIIYLAITQTMAIDLLKLYDSLFYYSIFISLIPMFFSFIFLMNNDESILPQNGFISGNQNGFVLNGVNKAKTHNSTAYTLFGLGIVFFGYNLLLKIISPPYYLAIALPVILSTLVLKKKTRISLF